MELEGRIVTVMPAQSGVSQSTGNQWMTQEYLMEYFWFPNQTRPSNIVLRAFGEEKIKNLRLQTNDEVRVRFHVEAHEYNGRWFNETRIDSATFIGASAGKNKQPTAEAAGTAAQSAAALQQPTENQPEDVAEDNDLPF